MPTRERAIARLDSAPPTFSSRCEACRRRPGREGVPSTIVSPAATTSTTVLTTNPFLRAFRKCKRCGVPSLPGTPNRDTYHLEWQVESFLYACWYPNPRAVRTPTGRRLPASLRTGE